MTVDRGCISSENGTLMVGNQFLGGQGGPRSHGLFLGPPRILLLVSRRLSCVVSQSSAQRVIPSLPFLFLISTQLP